MKKIIGIIIAIVLIAVAGLGIVKGKEYYNDRYVGEKYYAVVPDDYPMDLEMDHDDRGEEVGLAREYKLIGYNEKGESKELEFYVRTDDPKKLYQRGTYLEVERSNQLVVREKSIEKSKVPEKVLKLIEGNK